MLQLLIEVALVQVNLFPDGDFVLVFLFCVCVCTVLVKRGSRHTKGKIERRDREWNSRDRGRCMKGGYEHSMTGELVSEARAEGMNTCRQQEGWRILFLPSRKLETVLSLSHSCQPPLFHLSP